MRRPLLWRPRNAAPVALWALALVNLLALRLPPDRTWQGGNDFLSFYAGAALATSDSLYDAAAIRRLQQQRAGWDSAELAFIRPPFYAWMLSPLSRFPYPVAYRIWAGLQLAALVACAALLHVSIPWWWTFGAMLASVPLYAACLNAQDVPLLLLCLAAGWRLQREDRHPFAAGMVLSFCAIKFHLFLALPLMLVLRRRWRVCQGLCAGWVILTAASFVVQGWDWPLRYQALLAAPAIGPGAASMPNWHGVLTRAFPSGAPVLWEIVLSIATLVALWLTGRNAEPSPTPGAGDEEEAAFATALLAGLLVSHHAYVQDAAILVPAGLLLLRPRPGATARFGRVWWMQACAWIALGPVPWLYCLAGASAAGKQVAAP